MEAQLKEILKKYWGFEHFRSLQEEIITSILEDNDTLAVLPTGGGKSLCFQVPAMIKEGICIVITPLIALMKDQVQHLKQKGIPALSLYSGMGYKEVKKTLQNAAYGNYKFLYVSPERLESSLFLEHLPGLPINLIAVDEAHCVSQWGYDFRPPYLRIANIREYFPGVPILALTASATIAVQDDIIEKLEFRKGFSRFQKSFDRPELSYSVFNVPSKQTKLLEIIKNVEGSGIVYCKSRKRTQEVAELLKQKGVQADYYHAGLPGPVRSAKQEAWVNDNMRIMVCTNAFGMGIDKGAVRLVVHYDMPDALENYYQEAGRAGRDGKKAYAVLLHNDPEIKSLKEQAEIKYPDTEEVRSVYKAIVNYLQVPAGSGEGEYYDFEISDFANKFKLNAFNATYSLKILEQEDIIAYNEQVFIPSTVMMVAEKEDIEEFQRFHPQLDTLIKGLLRSYGGLFDFPTTINEYELAKFINSNVVFVKQGLDLLDKASIIEYQPQKDKPQIQFLKERVRTEDLQLNQKNIAKRKAAFEGRVDTIVSYALNKETCRSIIIGNYFGDTKIGKCGVCDNCLEEKNDILSREEFDDILAVVLTNLALKPHDPVILLQKMHPHKKEHIWKVINYLQDEKRIMVTKEGMLARK